MITMLVGGESYTFMMKTGELFSMKSEDQIKERVSQLLDGIAIVYSVGRFMSLTTVDYLIRLAPNYSMETKNIDNPLREAFNQLGYSNAVRVDVKRGEAVQDLKRIVEDIADTASVFAKPVSDFFTGIVRWLALGIAAGIVIYLIIRRAKA